MGSRKTALSLTMVVISLLAVALWLPSMVSAITNGQLDGNGHPYVGVVVIDIGGQPAFTCSGSLIAPTVFLTAGHCTSPASGARVWFEPTITDPQFPYGGGTSIEAVQIVTNPAFCFGCGHGKPAEDTHDQGILILETPVNDKGFALLPSQGLVDALPMNTAVTLVGYGAQELTRGRPPHEWQGKASSRNLAPSLLIQSNGVLSTEFMKLTLNPAQGKGGVSIGDSGGPALLGNIVLGTTTLGNSYECAGITYSERTDTADALVFINSFLK